MELNLLRIFLRYSFKIFTKNDPDIEQWWTQGQII